MNKSEGITFQAEGAASSKVVRQDCVDTDTRGDRDSRMEERAVSMIRAREPGARRGRPE